MKERKDGVSSRVSCEECTDVDRESRGCDGGVTWKVGQYDVDRCPENYVTPENITYINMWNDYRLFGFPFPCHWSEQPAYVIDAIRTLEYEVRQERKN